MGSFDGGGAERFDALAGSLVWVRRRNGSWWPGRILGLDELPPESSIPPRAGTTPIKLLGKEDGSMDWYNLEKTTRIKAFRCGDYDDDIEKAKVSLVHSNRKAFHGARYVRREDAIIHALELEKKSKPSESQEIYSESNNGAGKTNNHPLPCSVTLSDDGFVGTSFGAVDMPSPRELSQSVLSFEEPYSSGTHSLLRKSWKHPYDSDDDYVEGSRRIMGLNNLRDRRRGDPLSSQKRKHSQASPTCENPRRRCRRCLTLSKLLNGPAMETLPPYRRDTLARQSAAPRDGHESPKNGFPVMVGNGSTCSSTSCEETPTDISEDTFSDTVEGRYSSSETEDDEPLTMMKFVCNGSPGCFRHDRVGRPTPQMRGWLGGETGSSSCHAIQINARNVSSVSHPSSKGRKVQKYLGLNRTGAEGHHSSAYSVNRPPGNGVEKTRYRSLLEAEGSMSAGFYFSDALEPQGLSNSLSFVGYNEAFFARDAAYNRFSRHQEYDSADGMDSIPSIFSLYDVEVSVQRSYPSGPRIPLVSLRSQADDMAVVGHPASVEVLEDGHCDVFLTSNALYCRESQRRKAALDDSTCGYSARKKKKKTSGDKRPWSSPRKIRRLSSIASVDRLNSTGRSPLVIGEIKGPAVTCVPMRLVFSRLSEALSKPLLPLLRPLPPPPPVVVDALG